MIFRFSVLLACIAMTTNQVFAGLIVTISPVLPSYEVGSTVSLNVFVSTDTGTQAINGFDLTFDMRGVGGANLGTSLPTGITQSAGFITNALLLPAGPLGGTSLQATPDALTDVYITADGLTTFTTAPIRIFTLNFDIGASAATGAYAFNFVPSPINNFYDLASVEIAPVTFNNGSFLVITAVPEPSSMVLVGLVMAGAAGIRHRVRKKVQA